MKKLFLIPIGIITLFSLSFYSPENIYTIKLIQHDCELIIDSETQIELDKDEFGLQFYIKPYSSEKEEFNSAQIALFDNHNTYRKIKPGMSTENIPCFAPGTGLAGSRQGYKELFINEEGHHYLYYISKNDRRVSLIEKEGEYLKVEFPIKAIYEKGKIKDLDLKKLYFAILIDRNNNGVIDSQELTKFIVKFK